MSLPLETVFDHHGKFFFVHRKKLLDKEFIELAHSFYSKKGSGRISMACVSALVEYIETSGYTVFIKNAVHYLRGGDSNTTWTKAADKAFRVYIWRSSAKKAKNTKSK